MLLWAHIGRGLSFILKNCLDSIVVDKSVVIVIASADVVVVVVVVGVVVASCFI